MNTLWFSEKRVYDDLYIILFGLKPLRLATKLTTAWELTQSEIDDSNEI